MIHVAQYLIVVCRVLEFLIVFGSIVVLGLSVVIVCIGVVKLCKR